MQAMRTLIPLLGAALAACESTHVDPIAGELALVVTAPRPGEELAGEPAAIVVTGSVDTSRVRSDVAVWVNGIEAAVDGDQFTVELPAEAGINHIAVEASDGLGVASEQLDVMWAPAYLAPVAGTAGFEVADAVELRLGQRFFDLHRFGSVLDLASDPIVAGDLASALELVLHHVDLAALVPGGITFGEGDTLLQIAIPAAAPSKIVVDARIVDAPTPALELSIDLLGVSLGMAGEFRFSGNTMIIAGGITADLHASARLSLALAADGTIAVEATDVVARIGPLDPAFTGPDGEELDALITIGESDFRRLVEALLAEELVPTFTERVPPLLETLLGSVDELLGDTEFMLDTGLGTPVMLQLAGHIGGLDVVPGPAISTAPGHVTVRQHLSIQGPGAAIHPTTLGAPQVAAAPVRPAGNATGLDLALRLDLMNALLHSLWNRGLLEGQAALGGFNAGVSAKLSPVIRATPPSSACEIDGEPCDVTLQLGQLEVDLADFGQRFAVNATAGARIVVDGATVSLVIQQVPELIVWETANTGEGRLTPEAVSDLIKNVVWPELFGAIGENLSITLPLPDLSTLGLDDLAPGLADAELELAVRPRATVDAGYFGIGADLRLAAPSPP
jgi:hypothetical protein